MLSQSNPIKLRATYLQIISNFQYDKLSESVYPGMSKTMFVLFQILIPILLLNMLIAMMGNTYAIVNEKSEKEFLKQVKTSCHKTFHKLVPDCQMF
jgi:transient receptor potential cation channel subfamily V protein 6